MIEYILKRKKIKNIIIRIKNGEVIVSAPLKVSQKKIDSFVLGHRQWIEAQLSKECLPLSSGDSIRILENEYTIYFIDGSRRITEDKIYCKETSSVFHNAVLKICSAYFQGRFNFLCHKMNISDIELHLGFYSSKWGSCTPSKRRITINANLAFTDKECIDAILVHELCHLSHMDHSRAFYDCVTRWMPNYKLVHKRLKTYSIPYIKRDA